eukprot:CAMPEP_0185042680 /NCGR_PEP_ID=MMETSP1103-20130426/42490_1 /TAXON_ID=36769 /ORGANISM="Paraphysomonas bandaiensis, Strain Caron Lab Isolate" /LENGTH=1107 /DNA_ID=CAMNT_0027582787 /DNA_START=644 /DNA_END=3967 /DNA_ORIENTATION=-
MKSFTKPLNEFLRTHRLPVHTSIETFLVLPVDHYTHYMEDFNRLVYLCKGIGGVEGDDSLKRAADALLLYSREVDDKLAVEREKQMLLVIQSQFINNPKIFTPNRIFIREGDLERICMEKKVNIVYRAHLFNDAFIISRKLTTLKGRYKFHRAVDLASASVARAQAMSLSHAFAVTTPSMRLPYIFACTTAEEMEAWMGDLQMQIDRINGTEGSRRLTRGQSSASVRPSSPSVGNSNSVTVSKNLSFLSSRFTSEELSATGNKVTKDTAVVEMDDYMSEELSLAQSMSAFNDIAIQPLIDASKGAELTVGQLQDNNQSIVRPSSGSELFDRKGSYTAIIGGVVARIQTQSIADTLKDADVQIYLRVTENLVSSFVEFLMLLEMSVSSSGGKAQDLYLGAVCLSQQVGALFQQMVSYASGYQAAIRVLNSSQLAQFKSDAEERFFPSTFESVIYGILKIPDRLEYVLSKVLKLLPGNHSDKTKLTVVLERIQSLRTEMRVVIKEKANYEKLLEIKNCFVPGLLQVDPVLQYLISNEREFIRDGVLTKICRKENKIFKFWLFNDYLVYGTPLPGGKYRWNRAMSLLTCTAQKHTSLGSSTHAFEILGAEKSFVVIASNAGERDIWLDSIHAAVVACRQKKGVQAESVSSPGKSLHAAIWVPDSVGVTCCVCNAPFKGFTNRKHHCRQCGKVVCGEHSTHRKVLEHINKKKPERVCDICFPLPVHPTSAISTEDSLDTTAPTYAGNSTATPISTPIDSSPIYSSSKIVARDHSPSSATSPNKIAKPPKPSKPPKKKTPQTNPFADDYMDDQTKISTNPFDEAEGPSTPAPQLPARPSSNMHEKLHPESPKQTSPSPTSMTSTNIWPAHKPPAPPTSPQVPLSSSLTSPSVSIQASNPPPPPVVTQPERPPPPPVPTQPERPPPPPVATQPERPPPPPVPTQPERPPPPPVPTQPERPPPPPVPTQPERPPPPPVPTQPERPDSQTSTGNSVDMPTHPVAIPPPPPGRPPAPPPRNMNQDPPSVSSRTQRRRSIGREGGMASLLASIQAGGTELRKVEVETSPRISKPVGGGMMDMLATVMMDRRMAMMEGDISSDSDSSDEWDDDASDDD